MKYTLLTPVLGMLSLWSCAGAPVAPRELVDARAAYSVASSGAASRLALVDLHAAREDLDRAETSFRDDPTSEATVDLAYIAERHAQTAAARGDTMQSDHDRELRATETAQRTTQQLAQTRTELQQSQQAQSVTAQALTGEREARIEAQRQAQAALASLRQIAVVREEQRGTIITLSGEVLFTTGESILLPVAQQRLDQIARALQDQGVRHLTVEGYTDSRGSPAANEQLSLARANSVRNYLVTRGIAAAQIDARGFGAANPLASNDTAEGRANNRRVQIVVAPASPASPAVAAAPSETRR